MRTIFEKEMQLYSRIISILCVFCIVFTLILSYVAHTQLNCYSNEYSTALLETCSSYDALKSEDNLEFKMDVFDNGTGKEVYVKDKIGNVVSYYLVHPDLSFEVVQKSKTHFDSKYEKDNVRPVYSNESLIQTLKIVNVGLALALLGFALMYERFRRKFSKFVQNEENISASN